MPPHGGLNGRWKMARHQAPMLGRAYHQSAYAVDVNRRRRTAALNTCKLHRFAAETLQARLPHHRNAARSNP